MSIGYDREEGDGWSLVTVHIRVRRWTLAFVVDLSKEK